MERSTPISNISLRLIGCQRTRFIESPSLTDLQYLLRIGVGGPRDRERDMTTDRIKKHRARETAEAFKVNYTEARRHIDQISERQLQWVDTAVMVPFWLPEDNGVGSIITVAFGADTDIHRVLSSSETELDQYNCVMNPDTVQLHLKMTDTDLMTFTMDGAAVM